MKVLFISNLFSNSAEPARGIFNFHQMRHLARLCEVRAVAPLAGLPFQAASPIPASEEIGGITVHHPRQFYLPKLGRPLNPRLFALSIRKTIHRLRAEFPFDVFFANWAYPDACGVAQLARSMKIPLVVSISGSDANVYLNYRIRRRQILAMLAQAHAVTVRSGALRDLLQHHGVPADKIHVLYNGVDASMFQPATTQPSTLTSRPSLLYVGRLSPEKGVADLIAAVATLRHRPQLVIVGDGRQRQVLEQQARAAGVEVTWAGAKRPEEISGYMNRADLLCIPSHSEGVPNVALEAFACGLPVVATSVGGIPEVVTAETGVLTEPHNVIAFADAITQALQRPWNRPAIRAYAGKFDWTENARKLFSILQSAVHPCPSV